MHIQQVAVRNDWSLLTKTTANEVLKLAIQQRDPEGALQFLRKRLTDMRAGKLDITNFIISKQLHTYEPKTKSPHTTLAQRIKAKNPSAAPVLGTKVSYVFKAGPGEISDRAFLPEDVKSTEIDMDFYFNNQILKPLTEILGPLIKGGPAKVKRLLTNEHSGSIEITTLFKRLSDEPVSEREPAVKKVKRDVKCLDLASMFQGQKKQAVPADKKPAAPQKAAVKSKNIAAMFAGGKSTK
jgi:DNA polymerase family B